MKIYYQWFPWAYSNKASIQVAQNLNIDFSNISWVKTFGEVFKKIDKWNIWVLPIENSYAGSIHENFYHIISWNYKIIWELNLDINHFLLWNTKKIKDIKLVYSHPQALMQCQDYFKKHKIKTLAYSDTAWAAKFVKDSWSKEMASISSDFASEIYWLNILDKGIQDQNWNTTRFFIIVSDKSYKKYKKKLKLYKNNKISIIFKTKNIPSALYKCLGAFATRFINLTKIESLPARESQFEYIFWIDFQRNVDDNIVQDALNELKFFSKDLIILWDY